MKTIKITTVLALLIMLSPIVSQAQEEKAFQAFLVHEDQVKPSRTDEYEKTSKDFIEACKKHGHEDSWNVAQMSNGKYLSITPIEELGDIDNASMAPLIEKMGEENFSAIFDRFNTCYDKHGSYVVIRNNNLSYMPDGMSTTQEGQNYRKWHFIYVTPENRSEMSKNMKAVKELFESKNSKMHYRVYVNGFGQIGDYFLVVVSAKDAEDYAKRAKENRALLGPDAKATFDAVFNLASDYEEVTGDMRPDLSYSHKAKE